MANTSNPMGLIPIGNLGGGTFSGKVGRYWIPSTDTTAVYIGALVKPAGSASPDGVMSVTGGVTTGQQVVGVVTGVELATRDSTIYRVASTERYVYVADDPNTLFEIQDNGTAAVTDAGNVADLATFTAGSTVTGRSSMVISAASKTASGDGTEDVLLIGLVARPTNAFGASAKWVVRLNNHFYVDGTTGA